jgi:hypothetical protein
VSLHCQYEGMMAKLAYVIREEIGNAGVPAGKDPGNPVGLAGSMDNV